METAGAQRFILLGDLLVQSQSHIYGASYRTSYHRVVTDAEEAHHFNVGEYGRRTCKLSVRVHTAHGVGHTVRSGDTASLQPLTNLL